MNRGANCVAISPSGSMAEIPHVTEADARQAYELADFELDRLLFATDDPNPVGIQLAEIDRDRAYERGCAVLSQVPDRTPFNKGGSK